MNTHWLALMIGNSRLHWGWFSGESLQSAWDSAYLPASAIQMAQHHSIAIPEMPSNVIAKLMQTGASQLLPVYLASVVPDQTAIWQAYPDVHMIRQDAIPIRQMYPTLGIDRALALWGAGETWGFPVLVIDAGTALTFTGANRDRTLVGGAILPGVGLQFQSLANRTAALPHVNTQISLPPRWASNTPESLQSGIIYTLIAGIQDYVRAWLQDFPKSCIVLTGGDRTLLYNYLRSQHPDLAAKIISDANLIFRGFRYYWQNQ